MHNPPRIQLSWVREGFGLQKALANDIEYTAQRRHRNSWTLTARRVSTKTEVYTTTSDTVTSLRAHAAVHHTATMHRLGIEPDTEPAPPTLGPALLRALHLPDSSFEVQRHAQGWYAHYRVRPPGHFQPVQLAAFKPSPGESLAQLETDMVQASRPGGSLCAELTERGHQ